MVEGELRSYTKTRIHKCITIMFNEFKAQSVTLDDLVVIFDKQYNIPAKKQRLNGYLQEMKKHIKFTTKIVMINRVAYKIDGEQVLDLQTIWPAEYKEVKTRNRNPKIVAEINKFDPPRSPLINKLLGLRA